MANISHFTVADWVVFSLTIGISLSIGIFFAIWERLRKHNTLEHYFLAGRRLQTIPVAVSFVVTFQSSIAFLGLPAEGYVYGAVLAFYALGYVLATVFAAFIVVPLFHPLKLVSVYEYLYLRHGNRYLQYFTLITGTTYTVFYLGTVTYGTCVALELVIGIPIWATTLIFTLVTTLYTAVGGIKAVVWTDVFQFIVMVSGIIAVITKATIDTGGTGNVYDYAEDHFHNIDFGLDPRLRYTVWNLSIGKFTGYLISCFMQPGMQRLYSTPSVQTARRMYLLSIPGYCLILILASIEGAVIFAYFVSQKCDIFRANIIENINAVLPFTILDLFRNQPGLAGLFIAALSSAALSTLSSCLSSLSAIMYIDIIKVKYPNIKGETATKLSKVLVMFFGVVAMGMTFLCSVLPGSIVAVFQAFVSCLDGPTCAIFVLSALFRRSTTKGLFIAAVIGTCLPLWINFGRMFSDIPADPRLPSGPVDQCYNLTSRFGIPYDSNKTIYTNESASLISSPSDVYEPSLLDEFYRISFMWWSLLGFLVTVIFGIIISIFTEPQNQIDERCVFSFKKHFLHEIFKSKSSNYDNNEPEEMSFLRN